MRKKAQKTGNYHSNRKGLNIKNQTTWHINCVLNVKWAALKKQGPCGADQPPCKKHELVRHCNTAIVTTLKRTYDYFKLLQTTSKKCLT